MIVHVTQEHIAKGEKWHRCYCPIAIAIKAALDTDPKFKHRAPHFVSVSKSYVYLESNLKPGTGHKIPDTIVQRIVEFDKSGMMSPFSFRMCDCCLAIFFNSKQHDCDRCTQYFADKDSTY